MLKPNDPARQPPEPPEPGDERPIGELVHQLVEEGKAYAQAELGVARAIASAKADRLRVPAILLGAALLFAQAAVTVLAVAVFLGLLALMGPILAGLLAFLVFAGGAAALAWFGIEKAKRDL
ncbi:MAG TPA: phage holin family protein [Sphingomicrobium sp.]|nr:phage holin family protein [Sphingomicrobium sp.]